MRLFTNINRDDGEYFVFNLTEAKKNYKAEKSQYSMDEYPYKNFQEYLDSFIELDKKLQGNYQTNVRNRIAKIQVVIDKKRNLIDYDTIEIIGA